MDSPWLCSSSVAHGDSWIISGPKVDGEDQTEYCKLCKKSFKDFDAFTIHKIQSKFHIACFVCGRDFKTLEGCVRHQHQDHAADQDLTCVGCGDKFTRAGAYISHIEQHKCRVIHKEEFDRRRDEKEIWHKAPARGETFGKKPLQSPLESLVTNTDSSWGIPPAATFDMAKDFPALPTEAYKNAGAKLPDLLTGGIDDANIKTSNWTNVTDNAKQLFPNAPAAIEPPAELLSSLSIKPKNVKDDDDLGAQFDPDHPSFDPSKWYNPYVEKYRCPWRGCNKMQKHIQGLKRHLKSPAHMNEQLSCPGCLRIFHSATALTQHAESQSIKCSIRNSEKYRQAVDQITGGFIDIKGKHSDDTIKYITPQHVDVAERDKINAAHEAYWAQREEERQAIIKKQEENVGKMTW